MSGLRRGSGFRKGRTRMNQVSPHKSDQRQADEAWSAAVLERDRYTCQAGPDGNRVQRVEDVECRGRRDPHHIRAKGLYGKLRHVVGNGVCLCRAHHDWVHFQNPDRARELGLKGDGMITQEEANYRPWTEASKHCGNCVMFDPVAGTCDLVAGRIEADHVCDRWEAEPKQ